MRLTVMLAALACLYPAAAETGGDYAGAISAAGTEPFWGLSIDPAGDTIWLHEMDGTGYPTSTYVAPVAGTDGSATFTTADFTVRLKVTGECSDGISYLTFPMEATVTAGDRTFRGCAWRRWDNDLIALLPQVDACHAAGGSRGPVPLAERASAGAASS